MAAGSFHFAVSGGHTPWAMFAELAHEDVPWESVVIYQVDERVAPPDDPDRNLHHLEEALGSAPAQVRPMPVNDPDLEAAAAALRRPRCPSTSTSSTSGSAPTGTPPRWSRATRSSRSPTAWSRLTQPYQDRVRMTLTYPALARARQILWLITGEDKKEALQKLLAGDTTIPAGRVEAESSLVLADQAAL